jgi:hypothetical protein
MEKVELAFEAMLRAQSAERCHQVSIAYESGGFLTAEQPTTVCIKVADQYGNEAFFRVKRNAKMEKLMDVFA